MDMNIHDGKIIAEPGSVYVSGECLAFTVDIRAEELQRLMRG